MILPFLGIGPESIVGAHRLVTRRTVIAPRSLVLGTAVRVVRDVTEGEIESIRYAKNYREYTRIYLGLEQADGNPFDGD